MASIRCRRALAGLGVATLAVAVAAGSTGCDWVQRMEPPVPTSIVVTPSSATLRSFGETTRFSAFVHDQNGQVIAETAVTWMTSDASAVAVDSAGVVTAVGNGHATVTASAGGVTGAAAVLVAQRVSQVVVAPSVDTLLALGDTVRLSAEAKDANDHLVEGTEFTWVSSDASMARVDGAGLVTAARNGTVEIQATAGEATGAATIRIVQAARSIVLEPAASMIAVGDTLTLSAKAFDGNGHVMVEPELRWSSSDTTVALVDNSGLVQGVTAGNATITATADDAHGRSEITVESPDREVLAAVYQATGGPEWRRKRKWLTPEPLGDWEGVTVDVHGRVTGLELDRNDLIGVIPAELASLANLTVLRLGENALSGSIPPALATLGKLEVLELGGNSLVGPIPPELGDLSSLQQLNLGGNALVGSIPQTFLRLQELTRAGFGKGICVPGTSVFVAWLQERGVDQIEYPRPGVTSYSGPRFCNGADVGVLRMFYETTGGPGWITRDGWHGFEQTHDPTDFALEEWYGVTADSLGRVTGLDLARNGLDGALPTVLSELPWMSVLKIGGNALSGRLPLSLSRLKLREFRYARTGLCVPSAAQFQAWVNAIPLHQGTGAECATLSDREILEVFYEATSVRFDWIRSDNWLTAARLGDWYGVSVDDQGRVTRLVINANNVSGSLPAEIGQLSALTTLDLAYNRMTGPVPPELGRLANLKVLRITGDNLARSPRRLANNDLTGAVPPELGQLANLEVLDLGGNDLTGSIPPEIGDLSKLERLNLGGTYLSGSVPRELGKLRNLKSLDLAYNRHSGSIPVEIGNLRSLERLHLRSNDLTGAIPRQLGNLPHLTALDFTENRGLEGPLPLSLTALPRIEELGASGTGLCVPSDPAFLAWLRGIDRQWIAPCSAPMVYLTQAVQSSGHGVPLVAGENALLRVFVTANQPTHETLPGVRARFYVNGREVHTADIPGKSTRIPTEVDEGRLSTSANAEIPGSVIKRGLELVIEVDPAGTVDRGLRIPARIPTAGRLAIDVREMPVLDLTLIPFVWRERPDWSIIDLIEDMAEEPDGHEMLWATRTLLPVGDIDVKAHEAVLTSTTDNSALLRETGAIRAIEGGTGHYMGMMAGTSGGVAWMSGRSSFSSPDPETMAHELGHNFNLPHAPCDVEGPWFPHPEGSIGVWGYDFRDGGRMVDPSRPDLMSYCHGPWISDYHFTKAAQYRSARDRVSAHHRKDSPHESLLLWGGTDSDGVPFLEPAFVIEAPASTPSAGGSHRLTGRTADGTELFSFAFDMPVVADGGGGSSFAFVLPVQEGWEGNLASISLIGPHGSVTLDKQSNIPVAILRNPRTGQIRGILRDWPVTNAPQGDAVDAVSPPSGTEVLFSRGIPRQAANETSRPGTREGHRSQRMTRPETS